MALPQELLDHLGSISRLTRDEAGHLAQEVLAYFSETPEGFVQRRHAQLKDQGMKNPEIFEQLSRELGELRFAAPELSARQLRRIVYG